MVSLLKMNKIVIQSIIAFLIFFSRAIAISPIRHFWRACRKFATPTRPDFTHHSTVLLIPRERVVYRITNFFRDL